MMSSLTSRSQGACLVSNRWIRVALRLPLSAASRYGSHAFFRGRLEIADAEPAADCI
jgi:hypothetical protein